MSLADEARLRAETRDDWRIETEHYVVSTNRSLEEAVALALSNWNVCKPFGSKSSPAISSTRAELLWQ